MKSLIILAIICGIYAIPLDNSCSRVVNPSISLSEPLLCGTDPVLEKLVCVGSKCLGTADYSNCGTNKCATGFFCNEVNVCQACAKGCAICKDLTKCDICLPKFTAANGTCNANTDSNCLYADSTGCTICASGFYVDTGVCKACPSGCSDCGAADTCRDGGCGIGKFWDSTAKSCSTGISNCLYESDAGKGCLACNYGYYKYTDAQGVVSCNKGPENCAWVTPAGSCKVCNDNYYFIDSATGGQCKLITVDNCLETTSGSDCTKCKPGYFLHYNCATVAITQCAVAAGIDTCTTCNEGYYYDASLAVASRCTSCTAGCKACTKSNKKSCTACKAGYVFVSDFGCKACAANCKTCTSTEATKCLTCNTGYWFDAGTGECKAGITGCTAHSSQTACTTCDTANGYKIHTTNKCGKCNAVGNGDGCTTCTDAGCTAVAAGWVLQDTLAYIAPPGCAKVDPTKLFTCTDCKTNYYKSGTECKYCGNGCTACGASGCTAAATNAILVGASSNIGMKCSVKVSTDCNPEACTVAAGCVDNAVTAPTETLKWVYTGALAVRVKGGPEYDIACGTITAASGACTAANPGFWLEGTAPNQLAVRPTTPVANCFKYTSGTDCSECLPGYYLESATSCKACADADAICTTCSPTANTGCTATPDGYVAVSLVAKKCKVTNCKTCPAADPVAQCTTCYGGYAAVSNKCEKVIASSCATILGTDEETCDACKDGYFMPLQTVGGSKVYSPCMACRNANCATCDDPYTDKCKVCLPGYFLDTTTQLCAGSICTSGCKDCATTSTCKGCSDGYFLKDGVCTACASGCKTCTTAAVADCSACFDGKYLGDGNACNTCDGGAAVAKCEKKPAGTDGKELSGAKTKTLTCVAGSWRTHICDGPVTGCNTPSSSTTCTSTGCAKGNFISATMTCTACDISGCTDCPKTGECTACKDGTFKESKDGKTVCTACDATCAKCSGAANTQCTACPSGQKVASGKCAACDDTSGALDCHCGSEKFWNSTTKSCSSCTSGCLTCNNDATCQVCKAGYYLDSFTNKCTASFDAKCTTPIGLGICKNCVAAFYLDTASNTCKDCATLFPDCKACDATSCKACKSGFYFDATAKKCTSCAGNLTNCDTCSKANVCDQCKTGFYWDATAATCKLCMSGCKVCAAATTCATCDFGFLKNKTNGCEACSAGCKTCNNATNCTVCKDGYFMDVAGAKCNACHGICTKCTGASDANCTECITNATLAVSTCKCNTGMMYDSTKKMCVSGSTSSSAVYMFTGLLTLLVLLLAIF